MSVGKSLAQYGPRAADDGCMLAIENHQDFGSEELVAFCESTRGIGICLDAGNTFPVAEAPMDFYQRVAPYVRHSISRITASNSPTRAIGSCAARSATAPCPWLRCSTCCARITRS